jgi:Putative quorum-sensing-regulated virulence factor
MLSEKEEKLLRLALHATAFNGESDNAALALFRLLRGRGAQPEEFAVSSMSLVVSEPIYSRPDFGLVAMPWGKHKGSLLKDIPPAYLLWAVGWIRESEERAEKMKDLAEAIESFLNQ